MHKVVPCTFNIPLLDTFTVLPKTVLRASHEQSKDNVCGIALTRLGEEEGGKEEKKKKETQQQQ